MFIVAPIYGFLCLILFCYTGLSVLSSYAILLRESWLLYVNDLLAVIWFKVLWFFLAMPWAGLQCVIVVLPGHAHLPLLSLPTVFAKTILIFRERITV